MAFRSERRRILISFEDRLAEALRALALALADDLNRLRNRDGTFPSGFESEAGRLVSNRLILFFLGPMLDPYTTRTRPFRPSSDLARLIHDAVMEVVENAAEEQRSILREHVPQHALMALAAATRRDPAMPQPYYRQAVNGRDLTDRLWTSLEQTRRSIMLYVNLQRDATPEEFQRALANFLDQRLTLSTSQGYGLNGGYPASLTARNAILGAEGMAILYMSGLNPVVQEVFIERSNHVVICKTSICDDNEAGSPYPLDRAPIIPSHGSCQCRYVPKIGELQDLPPGQADYLGPLSPLFVSQFVNGF